MVVLPATDRSLLLAAYDGATMGSPRKRWRLEDGFGTDAAARIVASPFVNVVEDYVVPTYFGALALDSAATKADIKTVRDLLVLIRAHCRSHRRTKWTEEDLAKEAKIAVSAVRRIRFLLDPLLPRTIRVRTARPRGTIEFDVSAADMDIDALPRSPIPGHISLPQAAVLRFYEVRSFSGIVASPAEFGRPNLDFSETTISNSNLSRASLRGLSLQNAVLDRVSLAGADLSDADISRCRMKRVDFLPRDLRGANLEGLELSDGCQFEVSQLGTATWSVIYVDGRPQYRTGSAPLVFTKLDLGWSVTFLGEHLGGGFRHVAMGQLAILCVFPARQIHVFDLRAAERGELEDPRCDVTDSQLADLLARNDLDQAKKLPKKYKERARLAAVLRRAAYLASDECDEADAGKKHDDLLDYVRDRLIRRQMSFPQAGITTAVDSAINNLGTAIDAVGAEHERLRVALERAFTLQEFCSYHPGLITTPPDVGATTKRSNDPG